MYNIKITKNIDEANLMTHSGTFHADEIFGTIILSKIVIVLMKNALCADMEMNQILNLDYLMTKFNLNPKINLKLWGKLHKFMIKIIFQIRNIK